MLFIACITHSLSLKQVEKHYAIKTLQLEMHVGKLQLIATSMASNHMKVSWLVWWNSLTHTWTARKFVDAQVWKEKLLAWLGKACWYAGISKNPSSFSYGAIQINFASFNYIDV
jgi:hypothetical protein